MKFYEALSKKSRKEWVKLYEHLVGKWEKPIKIEDPILDDPSKLARFMSERPRRD